MHLFVKQVHNIVMSSNAKRYSQANILILMEWYDHHIREGIGRYAHEHNWHLTIDENSSIPKGWNGDGVLTVFNKRADIAEYVQNLKIPVVDMGQYHPEIQLPRVTGDNQRIGNMAGEHFAERGFKHTAWFSRSTTPIERMRFKGLSESCSKHGLEEPKQWVWEKHSPSRIDSWKALRSWLEKKLRKAPEPLAVFAYNDYDASTILYVCHNAGISVPQQVAILGVDDNELICLNQPVQLSSIIHNLNLVGYKASEQLDRLIKGDAPPADPILIPPKGIKLRQSTDFTAINIPAVRKAISFIQDNINRSIGINEIAEHAGVSRSTLDRLFLENFNRTVHNEVHRTRLSVVKSFLTTTNLPVQEIARQTGFCHAQYLNNLFKKLEGMTPREYRKRYK